MQIHRNQITFSWLAFVSALFMTGCFASLGIWQLNRAEEKRQLQNSIEQNVNREPLQLFSSISNNWEELRYRPIRARGYFANNFTLYLDNRVHNTKAGYHIILPFYLETTSKNGMSKTVILVNRGWVPVGNDRTVLPEVMTPVDVINISGRLSSPRSRHPMTGNNELPDAYSDQVWTYLDINYVKEKYQLQLEPYIILQENDTNDGLKRQLPDYQSNATMHIGYAIQWFAFALFVMIVFIKKGINLRISDE